MSDSAKYPGLCKQYDENDVEHNVAGSEYVDLEFNSINGREGNAGGHFTYKTYNGELESNKRRNNAVVVPVPLPSSTSYVNHQNFNAISNNELHSFVKRHQQSSEFGRQQQYAANRQQVQPNYQQNQQMTPFLQAFHQHQQQHTQKRPIDRTNPFQTYRWDQLFRNNNHV
jgi:hypothetical protein